jgi:hypothetical protein
MGHLFKDVKRTNLSELHVLPTLVDGKVVVINSDKTYTMFKPFNPDDIKDGFDPIDYDLCQADFYSYENHQYKLIWNSHYGKHIKQCIGSDKVVQYTTYRIGYASSDNRRIAKARREERLVNELYHKHLCEQHEAEQSSRNIKPGDKIHIKSRQGIYEVVSCDYYTITITCKRWSVDGSAPIKIISRNDFKCLAGGLHNWWR